MESIHEPFSRNLIIEILERTNQRIASSKNGHLLEVTIRSIEEVFSCKGILFNTYIDEKLIHSADLLNPIKKLKIPVDVFKEKTHILESIIAGRTNGDSVFNWNDLSDSNLFPELFLQFRSGYSVFLIGKAQKTRGFLHIVEPEKMDVDLLNLLFKLFFKEIDYQQAFLEREKGELKLKALIQIIQQISSTLDRKEILEIIINYAHRLLNAEAGSLFLKDETGKLVLQVSSNKQQKFIVPPGKGLIGHVVQNGEPLIVNKVESDPRHYQDIDKFSGLNTQSILAVPLKTRSIDFGNHRGEVAPNIIGGLEAINKHQNDFTQDDQEIMEALANQTATVLEIAQLYSQSEELFFSIIRALSSAVDAKDPYTRGHSERVSQIALAMADILKLSPEEKYHIEIGSLLHDIGKIGIPDNILSKPGKLNQSEYEEMKKHPEIGMQILSNIQPLSKASRIVMEHHERLNGSGYPNQKSGNEISLEGKIVALADVFDALTSKRPYRNAIPHFDAFNIILRDHTDEFDLKCLDALKQSLEMGSINDYRK